MKPTMKEIMERVKANRAAQKSPKEVLENFKSSPEYQRMMEKLKAAKGEE